MFRLSAVLEKWGMMRELEIDTKVIKQREKERGESEGEGEAGREGERERDGTEEKRRGHSESAGQPLPFFYCSEEEYSEAAPSPPPTVCPPF